MRLNSLKITPHLIIKDTENNSTNSSQFFLFPMYRKKFVSFYTFTQGYFQATFLDTVGKTIKDRFDNERFDVGRNPFAGKM